jgi:hypothetical protein
MGKKAQDHNRRVAIRNEEIRLKKRREEIKMMESRVKLKEDFIKYMEEQSTKAQEVTKTEDSVIAGVSAPLLTDFDQPQFIL